jgi:hypothetical protein
MSEQYAIINTDGGWLEFLTDWDKDLYPLWEPITGFYAVLASSIDINNLPPNPNLIVKYSAEEWLKNQGYDSTQLVTFTDMERQLASAGKASFLMDAVRAWANSVLAEYVAIPVSKSDWPIAPYNFNESITDGFNALNA